ncbi:adenosine 5'-phosphosulfate reductase [Corynebacterium renale]|uniref:Adenosine 5'-phosphosulfate reductase n=1 Tax=Corynebacterium renale TaxID=1724 RepID=A0A2A9DMP3_9CORY|nr:phosphoadenylyl-sulfate reductase [Corynebacterium renale]PFG27874.1 phosphoadenylylsulfate reductase (thioredoxin) [Corynebacterium renale]SQG63406.1 adenosine 5'-phosphosulfate reductase [Corynebacterium renale]SQI21978.1 adenosine 5'-phosphosulfate reductase [Corynebacterium renale]STC99957.1 adenosine 5'-phosphosulfate reductase [Corynebacterium renale]
MINFLNTATYQDPDVSPAQEPPRPLDTATAARNKQLVEQWADTLFDAPAEDILTWAHEHAPGPLAITLSMENTVLAHLGHEYLPDAKFLFLDTGYHFQETLDVADAVDTRYPGRLLTIRPVLSRAEQDATYGPSLYRSNPTACCRMRKVEPLGQALAEFAGWVTGVRRDDGPTRAKVPSISIDAAGRLKISPLVTWTLEDTDAYIAEHGLIEHSLTSQGYPSIGCATCTAPVAPGADPRSGRWAGQAKTECGLHT